MDNISQIDPQVDQTFDGVEDSGTDSSPRYAPSDYSLYFTNGEQRNGKWYGFQLYTGQRPNSKMFLLSLEKAKDILSKLVKDENGNPLVTQSSVASQLSVFDSARRPVKDSVTGFVLKQREPMYYCQVPDKETGEVKKIAISHRVFMAVALGLEHWVSQRASVGTNLDELI
jgi:hypothetical protein